MKAAARRVAHALAFALSFVLDALADAAADLCEWLDPDQGDADDSEYPRG